MSWHSRRDTRKIHRWGAIIIALPFLIVLITGLFLQLKKDVAWIQPASMEGVSTIPSITFEEILEVSKTIPEAEISSWAHIDRLDVRPDKGMVKVRAINHWEIQIDTETGEVLQAEFRRSDIIEAMHDGSWFHDLAKHWIFLPTGIIVTILWITGIYMFFIPYLNKRRNRKRLQRNK
ncbi:MAG: PepSY domain-containing protein [Balneola sp.]|nr:MAG: PepSY domain-containing protein [Balneola sp.]